MQQFHRVERYLQRVRQIYGGVPHLAKDTKLYEDDVITFFVHCHHLTDWAIDHYFNVTTKYEVQAFVNSNAELQLCADICNASKHCKLQRTRTGFQPSVRGRDWVIVTYKKELRKPITFFGKYRVISGDRSVDALELAESAFRLWRDFNRKLALRKV